MTDSAGILLQLDYPYCTYNVQPKLLTLFVALMSERYFIYRTSTGHLNGRPVQTTGALVNV